MIPEAFVSHEMSLRLRIKIPSKKGDVGYFSGLKERLSDCSGVAAVSVNPKIGSVLILHDLQTKDILAYARKKELFIPKRPAPPRRTLFNSVAETFRGYDRNLRTWTGGEIDIPSLVFLSLLVSGVYQIAKGNVVMPAWYTAFYYALGVFTRAQVDELDEGEEVLEDFDDADGD